LGLPDSLDLSHGECPEPPDSRLSDRTQKPGGFTRWLTRVHFGSSTVGGDEQMSAFAIAEIHNPQPSIAELEQNKQGWIQKSLTMYSLPILLFLPVED